MVVFAVLFTVFFIYIVNPKPPHPTTQQGQEHDVCLNPFCKLSFIARLRTQACFTGAPGCFAQHVFGKAFLKRVISP